MVVVEGPRFSTRAESRAYAAEGWTLINMTAMPEAALARELRMCYASIALVNRHGRAGAESAAHLPLVDVSDDRRGGGEHHLHVAGDHVLQGRRRALAGQSTVASIHCGSMHCIFSVHVVSPSRWGGSCDRTNRELNSKAMPDSGRENRSCK